jgi:hypothetical protein
MAFEDIPAPDHADALVTPQPAGSSDDPAAWAQLIFSVATAPSWVRLLFGARAALTPIIGIPRPPRNIFEVRRVEGDEALIAFDDRHLDFRCGVGVDAEHRLVRVITTVRLKGWRGRLYFAPVRLLHPLVVSSMLRRACRHPPTP